MDLIQPQRPRPSGTASMQCPAQYWCRRQRGSAARGVKRGADPPSYSYGRPQRVCRCGDLAEPRMPRPHAHDLGLTRYATNVGRDHTTLQGQLLPIRAKRNAPGGRVVEHGWLTTRTAAGAIQQELHWRDLPNQERQPRGPPPTLTPGLAVITTTILAQKEPGRRHSTRVRMPRRRPS